MKFETTRKPQKKKERLSKLQKWILEEIYIYGNKIATLGKAQIISRNELYYRAIEDDLFKTQDRKTNDVILSRSIWTLIEHGYIEAEGPASPEKLVLKYSRKAHSPGEIQSQIEKDFEQTPFMSMNKEMAAPARKGIIQAKLLFLTEKGKARAKELLNVKK